MFYGDLCTITRTAFRHPNVSSHFKQSPKGCGSEAVRTRYTDAWICYFF